MYPPHRTPHTTPNPPTESSLPAEQDAIWAAYQRMRVRLSELLNRELSQGAGLSEADFEILAFLDANPSAQVRAVALRCGLEWEKSRLSHQVRRMEERGLIQRLACLTDSRSFEVALTDEGREKVGLGQAIVTAVVQRHVFAALTPTQAEALHGIAEAILATMDSPSHAS